MRILMVISLIAVGLGLALVVREPAYARTRTPTPTATPTVTSTPTPVPPRPAAFHVKPWVNGRDDTARNVTAKIGGTLCATGQPSFPTGVGARPLFQLTVPAEEVLPGCGREGAVVTFFVNGQQAPQTAIWHSGISQHFSVIIGPPFARFSGVAYTNMRLGNEAIVPYVGDESCGDKAPSHWIGIGPYYSYGAVVYSNEQQAGCGSEGAQVIFKLLDAQGNVIAVANEKGTWHAWDGVSDLQHLDLTFGPAGGITVGGVGTGGSQGSGAALWRELSLVLAAMGLGGIAAGFAVQRRA